MRATPRWTAAVLLGAGAVSAGEGSDMSESREPISDEVRRIFDRRRSSPTSASHWTGPPPDDARPPYVWSGVTSSRTGTRTAGCWPRWRPHRGRRRRDPGRPNEYVLSVEFKINLLRPAHGGAAALLRHGAQPVIADPTSVESEVWAEDHGESKLVAKATVTLAVLARAARED